MSTDICSYCGATIDPAGGAACPGCGRPVAARPPPLGFVPGPPLTPTYYPPPPSPRGMLSLVAFVPGLLLVWAGYQLSQWKGRSTAIAALILGGLSSCAMSSCSPLAIGLAIYGLVVLNDPAVKPAFETQAGSAARRNDPEGPK